MQELESAPEAKTDLDKIAYAVSMVETHNCKLGYGAEYNNCFGITQGNTAPCKKVGRNSMCIYDAPEESYIAFKKIWNRWYGGGLPNQEQAKCWVNGCGSNKIPYQWIENVYHYYYS